MLTKTSGQLIRADRFASHFEVSSSMPMTTAKANCANSGSDDGIVAVQVPTMVMLAEVIVLPVRCTAARCLALSTDEIWRLFQQPVTDDRAKQPYHMSSVPQQRTHLLDIVSQITSLIVEKLLAFSRVHPICGKRC